MTRSIRLILAVVLCSTAGLRAQKALEIEPISAAELFAALDEFKDRALEGQDLDRLYAILKAGRPIGEPEFTGAVTVPFEDAFGRKTRIYLRIPKKPRAVLVMLHGLGGSETQLARAVHEKILEKEGIILLAPCAQGETVACANSDLGVLGKLQPHWWVYDERGIVMQALLSLARTHHFDRDRVWLVGHSMGGFGAWNLGLRFADRFAAACSLSGGLSRREFIGSKPHLVYHKLLDNARHLPFYFAHGDADTIVPVEFERRIHETLTERKIEHRYVEIKRAGHLVDLGEKGPIMPELSRFILDARRDPHPRRVVHRVIEDRPSRSFWLRIDRTWASTGLIEGRIDEKNDIAIRSSGVDEMTIFLDETMINLDRPVTVTVNGKKVHEGLVKPDLATLVDSWRGREDPALVCRASLRFKAP